MKKFSQFEIPKQMNNYIDKLMVDELLTEQVQSFQGPISLIPRV